MSQNSIQNISEKIKSSIYGAYRTTLRSMRGGRAGARKQRALKIVATRYHTPVSVVKNIVRAGDEINGILHDHSELSPKLKVVFDRFEYLKSINDGTCHFPSHDADVVRSPDEVNTVRVRVANDARRPEDYKFILSCFDCYLKSVTPHRKA